MWFSASEANSWREWGETYVRQYRRAVIWGMGGVVVLALCIGGILGYRAYQQRQGKQALQRGLSLLLGHQAKEAVASLEQATRYLSRGTARQLALVNLGKAYASQQQLVDAQRAYEQSLAVEKAEPYLAQIALLQLGQDAEQQQDLARAHQWYRQAAEMVGPLQETALLADARVLEGLGNTNAAHSVYKHFVEQYPDSPLVELVRQKIGQ